MGKMKQLVHEGSERTDQDTFLTLDMIAQIESLPPKSKEILDELTDLDFEGSITLDKIELIKLLTKAFLIGYYRGNVDKERVE